MALVNEYSVRLFGSREGYNAIRARIRLSYSGAPRGMIYFLDETADFPTDTQDDNGIITMHMPIALLSATVDLLRHESPVQIDYLVAKKKGVLSTEAEPIGQDEL